MEKIRKITSEDNIAIAKIIRQNLENFGLDVPGTAYFDPELDKLSEYYENNTDSRAYYILENDAGEIIGGIGFAEFPMIPDCAEIQKLYLSNAAKGRGLGRLMLEYAEKKAAEAGYSRLYLETHSCLTAAIRLYEKCGYREIPRPDFVEHSMMDRFYTKELKPYRSDR